MKSLKPEYKRLKKMAKDNPVLYVRLAGMELKMGKVNKAKIRLTEGLLEDPDNPTAHMMLAQTDILMGNQESALQEFEETLRIDPLNSRARKAYIDLLQKMGRTDQIYNAHSRLYELSPLDEDIKNKQIELVDKAMSDMLGEKHQWNDEWNAGDLTEIGGLSRAVCEELGVTPVRAHLPKQFCPDVDESLVTQIVSRLPALLKENESADPGSLSEQEATDSTTVVEPEALPEYDRESPSVIAADTTQATTDFPTEDISDAYADDEVEIVDETEDELTTEVDESTVLEDQRENIDEEGLDQDIEEVIEEVVEVAPTPLQLALARGGQPTEDVTDFETMLTELKSDLPPLVETPDLEGNITFAGSEESVNELLEDVNAESSAEDTEPAPTDEPESSSIEEPETGSTSKTETLKVEGSGQMDQDDLDTLLASFNSSSAKAELSTEETEPETLVEQEASSNIESEATEDESSGQMNQDDLDALMASFNSGSAKAESTSSITKPESPAVPESNTSTETDTRKPVAKENVSSGQMDQNDLNSLLASFKAGSVNPRLSTQSEQTETAETVGNKETGIEEDLSVEDLTIVDSGEKTTELSPPSPDIDSKEETASGTMDQDDLNALMASFKSGSKASSITAEPVKTVAEDVAMDANDSTESEDIAPLESVQDEDSLETTQESHSENVVDVKNRHESPAEPISPQSPDIEKPATPEPGKQPNTEQWVAKKGPQEEDLTDLISEFASKRRAKPGSQQPVEIGKYAAKPVEDIGETGVSKEEKNAETVVANTPQDINLTNPTGAEPVIVDIEEQVSEPSEVTTMTEPDSVTQKEGFRPYGKPPVEEKEVTEEATISASVTETRPEPGRKTPAPKVQNVEPEVDADTSIARPENVKTAAPVVVEPATRKALKPAAPIKRSPRPRPPFQRTQPPPQASRKDETQPEEYRGPVSKTLIKLQLGQGKIDHARAMLERMRQMNPEDNDLLELEEQIENAHS